MIVILLANSHDRELMHRLEALLRERAGVQIRVLEEDEAADPFPSEREIVLVASRPFPPFPPARLWRLLDRRGERREVILILLCVDPDDAYFYFREFLHPRIFDLLREGTISVISSWPPDVERAADLILRLLGRGETRRVGDSAARDSLAMAPRSMARIADMALLTQQISHDTSKDSATHFRVYHPTCCTPREWHTMMAYVHVPSAVEEVREHASRNFNAPPRESTAVEQLAIKRGARITVVPESQSLRFNPQQASFDWEESWHVATFRFFPIPQERTPTSATGRVVYYVGPVLVGEVRFDIEIGDRPTGDEKANKVTESAALPFQAVFVSYSHHDSPIVDGLEEAYKVIGMDYLRDTLKLRSGDKWNDKLLEMIDDADVFQLCWSDSANTSRYVEEEWRHALTLNRKQFIRPCYWQLPMPGPPKELSGLHFAFFDLGPSLRIAQQAKRPFWHRLLNTFSRKQL